LDLHAKQLAECRQLDGSTPMHAQQWDPWKLSDKVEGRAKAGIKIYSCYEAGPYWYHREIDQTRGGQLHGGTNTTAKPTQLTQESLSRTARTQSTPGWRSARWKQF